jgi:hypothetical protein
MPRHPLRSRPLLRAAAVALLVVAAVLPTSVAAARPGVGCKSADLRYPFTPGGAKTFGVFKLRVTGGHCATAHRVAKAWMKRFEANLRAGHVKLPHAVAGFTFTRLPVHAAQTYRLRGTRGRTTIRFDYRVPNG